MSSPLVSAVIPTFENEATLPAALATLAAQELDGDVELICVDGGSTDATLRIAEDHGARVVENPLRNEEEGRALGIEAATGELVLLLDADDELPATDWLARLVAATRLAPDVVSADPLFHEWRPEDPPVTRLCALIGGTDPLAIDLGWADRWSHHLGRWTGLEVEVEETEDALLVRVDPEGPPPMGSNRFLVRRDALLRTQYRPFVHSDVVGDLAEAGYRFARVREGVVHHYAPTLRAYARKARRRARRTIAGEPAQRRGFRIDRRRLFARAAWSLTVVGPAIAAVRGYRARPDRAWALLPALYAITTLTYVAETVRARLPGARSRVRGGDPPS